MSVVLAIDAGTTSVRTVAVDTHGALVAIAQREFPQHFPRPGWVEHDARDIWDAAVRTLTDVVARLDGTPVAAIGITNQRETVVAWDRVTGVPSHRALVWQDRRTAARCDVLRDRGVEPQVRTTTGLVLDPYFSATKIEWLLRDGDVVADDRLAVGTVDSWLLWNLTGGAGGGIHATEPSNASRTMVFDIDACDWSDELLDLFDVPRHILPEVRPSSGRFGTTDPACAAGLAVPVSGIAGDQQAALFGQACFAPGMTKNTYGTGSFVLVNLGPQHPAPVDGLITTVAWQLGEEVTYALEGSVFVTGAAIQWLRDGLGIIADAADAGPLAESVPDTGGVVFVPAFTGLGSPWWDADARGALLGLTRGTTTAHIARAAVEAMAWQTLDVVDAMRAAGSEVAELRVDGGRARWTCCAGSKPTCSA
jgi:glycerol kinase